MEALLILQCNLQQVPALQVCTLQTSRRHGFCNRLNGRETFGSENKIASASSVNPFITVDSRHRPSCICNILALKHALFQGHIAISTVSKHFNHSQLMDYQTVRIHHLSHRCPCTCFANIVKALATVEISKPVMLPVPCSIWAMTALLLMNWFTTHNE